MIVDKFFETLDSYFANQEIAKVDPFLVSSLEQAKEEEDYGAFCNNAPECGDCLSRCRGLCNCAALL